jgi:pilus assembly protein CpaC
MHRKFCTGRLLLGFAVLSLLVGGTAMAQPLERIVIPFGGVKPLQMKNKQNIKVVFVEKPDVIQPEQTVENPAIVLLKGLSKGTSRVELTDNAGGKESYEVVVGLTIEQRIIEDLQKILRQAVPTANVVVIPFSNGIILSGTVAHAEDVDTILKIADCTVGKCVINAMTVGGVQQVQLDVTVARVDRTRSRSRGFNFIVGGNTFSAGSILGGLSSSAGGTTSTTSATAGVGIIPSAVTASPTGLANIVFGVVPAQFQGLLQALTQEGLAKLIAEPKLVTQSGRPAHFESGGQQAIIGPSSGITGPGVILQNFGTKLDFLPVVYGNGKIYLEVAPEVSAVDAGLGLAASSTLPATPGFDIQNVRTSVVLESGQTFAIGGLIQTTVQSSVNRVPVLGEIPFIAPFFSTQTDTLTEQELVILVTPHLVDPMDCNQVPRRLPGLESRPPDDFEFYVEGIMEAPRGQRNVFENKHYKGAWKNDPTANSFPCATYNPNGGPQCFKQGGNCATGNCAAGACQPAVAAPAVNAAPAQANPKLPSDLPPAVTVPMDIPVPPKGR